MCVSACGKLPSRCAVGDGRLLREEADVVRAAEELLEELRRLVAALRDRERLDEPEAAGKERAFAGREAVVGRLGAIAVDQIVVAELPRGSRRSCRGSADRRPRGSRRARRREGWRRARRHRAR